MSRSNEGPRRPAWVLVPSDVVPPRWSVRSISVSLVPLLPDEARQVLREGGARPELDPGDEALATLIAGGRSVSSAARSLGISLRTGQRRLARLRGVFGVETTHELALVLARLGFGGVAPRMPGDVAGTAAGDGEPDDERTER